MADLSHGFPAASRVSNVSPVIIADSDNPLVPEKEGHHYIIVG